MTQTKNYALNIVEGTDIVNPLVDTNPNFTKLDGIIFNNQNRTIQECTEAYSEGVHAITCSLPSGGTFFHFTATSNFSIGDNFTFNGNLVTAFMPNGNSLYDNAFIINSEVLFSIIGSRMVIYTNSMFTINSATPCNLVDKQFLYQNNNKVASKPITPADIGLTVEQLSITPTSSAFTFNPRTRAYKYGKIRIINFDVRINALAASGWIDIANISGDPAIAQSIRATLNTGENATIRDVTVQPNRISAYLETSDVGKTIIFSCANIYN